MIIKNVKIYKEDKSFAQGQLEIADGIFKKVTWGTEAGEVAGEEVIDGEGCLLIPGLVDIHFHGCKGDDFCDGTPEAIANMAAYEAQVGVTSICPASMTVSEEEIHQVMTTAGTYQSQTGARLVGINMEGPFINVKKKGAQAAEHIKCCDVELFRQFQQEANGLIKLVDIAPETEGAMAFIDAVKDETVISIAHTTADYATAREALERGASHVTHLYNAMPPFTHREPGVIGAARDNENCHVELICDGIHIHPSVVRATFAMFGADRVILISDSMRATGLTDGQYTLGGQDVFVKGATATLKDGTIAGSVTNLMDCMKNAVKNMEIPLEDAIACATINPAREIGIDSVCGSIAEGKYADFVLMDADLNVKAVYVGGCRQ